MGGDGGFGGAGGGRGGEVIRFFGGGVENLSA